jgi:hypothetical protein
MADTVREKVHDAAETVADKTAPAPPPHFGDLAKSANDVRLFIFGGISRS